jgi:hypothetical protein
MFEIQVKLIEMWVVNQNNVNLLPLSVIFLVWLCVALKTMCVTTSVFARVDLPQICLC